MKPPLDARTACLLSLTSGRLLCRFDDMHHLAEHILGHPVWTHEFASPETCDALREAALRVEPKLALFDTDAINAENYAEMVAAFLAEHGLPDTYAVPAGDGERAKDPLTTLREVAGPEKPIVVAVPGGAR